MNRPLKIAKDTASKALDIILPPRCVVSGEMVDRQGMIAPESWSKLSFIADPQCIQCGIPFEYKLDENVKCASCVERPPPYQKARAALKYDETSRDLILGFKHGDQMHSVKAFTPWLEQAGQELIESADLLIPVPLHYRRLIARRYNQAAIIAQALSKATQTPCDVSLLKRTPATATQGRLKAAERHKNVKAAFAVSPNTNLSGKTILLIDDVFTTGATVKECTKILIKAGAAEVNVLTLARVVKEEFF